MTVTAERGLRVLGHSLALAPVGGVEVCTVQDAEALAARGHHVDLAWGADGPLRPRLERAGVGLHGPYPFAFSPARAVHDAATFLPAARLARGLAPDVVWLNRAEHLVWGQTVSRSSGAPLVCHLHALPPYRRMRLVGAGVAHYVAVSELVRQAYLEQGVPPDRITTLHNALPPGQYPEGGLAERAAARSALGLPQDVPLVLGYGKLSAEKGVLDLLEAWRTVRRRQPEAVLVLVDAATGPTDARVRQALSTLDPAAYRLFGMTPDVVPHLHASDVVAFPTRLPETFGRVALEALATGRPVVASRVGAVPEILHGPMARFLVEPGEPDELAVRLLSLLSWRRDEPGLQQVCTDWVATHFPFDRHVDGLVALLQASARSRRHGIPVTRLAQAPDQARTARRLRR